MPLSYLLVSYYDGSCAIVNTYFSSLRLQSRCVVLIAVSRPREYLPGDSPVTNDDLSLTEVVGS